MTLRLLAVLLALVGTSAYADEPERPNIVLIMADDMGYSDIGCYGGEIRTPSLDRLAANGVRFSQFYNVARCCPTRAALLTGMYPHQAGVGLMTGDDRLPGYRGDLGRDVVTIAEALRGAGYANYLSGKWHLTKHTKPDGPKDNWPLQRGFDRFYGTIIGAGSFYDPATLCRGNTFITPENDEAYQPDVFYYTDAITENAIAFLREHEASHAERPFFLYVAHTCAHWPMHALPEDIATYEGVYDVGFEPIREARLERLESIGLVPGHTTLTPAPDDWSRATHKAWDVRNMQVYAAMIDRMDQGIGRIVDELERQGVLGDTVIMYLQDNGGCAENFGRAAPKEPYPDYEPFGPDDLQTKIWPPMQTRDGRPVRVGPDVLAGAEDTFISYGRGWATVSNTPFQRYKHWSHEGGISTPLIVHWPNGVTADRVGAIEHTPGHVIDIMATCLDLARATHPERYGEYAIQPIEGVSLGPALRGGPIARTDALYFEHHLNGAIRDGDWKLVRTGHRGDDPRVDAWQLYDMRRDRTEQNDLAAEHPEIVARLAAKWEAWAERVRVKPWPWAVE